MMCRLKKLLFRKLYFRILILGFVCVASLLLLNFGHSTGITPASRYFTFQFDRFSLKFTNEPESTKKPCSCETCILMPGVSLWFEERYNQTVFPVMTKENHYLSEGTYTWWQKLQGEKRPANITVVLKTLFETLPGRNPNSDRTPSHCRRCAVVGNSGNLKGSNYGSQIDGHDFVFRLNHAPTIGFEADVGSKTTHQFMYPESAKDLPKNVSLVLVPFKTLDLQWIVSALTTGHINFTYTAVPRKVKINKDKVLIYSPTFMKYIYDSWVEKHGRYPSTGILAIIFALHLCDELDVYGFGVDSNGNWHHYWEKNHYAGAFRMTGVHDADFEANVTATLSSIGKIHLFRGK